MQVFGDDYTADDLIAVAEAEQWSPLHSPAVTKATATSAASHEAAKSSSFSTAPSPVLQTPSTSHVAAATTAMLQPTNQAGLPMASSGQGHGGPTPAGVQDDPLAALVSAHTASSQVATPAAPQR